MDWASLPRAGGQRVKLPYAESGAGPPVVLVHGSNSDHRIWDRHRDILSNRNRVIAVTQRYFGRDPWTDSGTNFSISSLADDLADFVQGLGLGPVTIVGWSFGGAVSLLSSLRNTSLVKRMILYEPSLATFLTDPEAIISATQDRSQQVARSRKLVLARDLPGALRALMDDIDETEGAFDGLPLNVRSMMIENARMLPLLFNAPPPPTVSADQLRGLSIPTTVATGSLSRKNYRIAAAAASKLLKRGSLVTIEGARHLWPITDPDGFSALVMAKLTTD